MILHLFLISSLNMHDCLLLSQDKHNVLRILLL